MKATNSRQTIGNGPDRWDPYYQYLKYGSHILWRDGTDAGSLGGYETLLMEEPEAEEYRQCWRNFRKERDVRSREKLIRWNLRMVYAVARCLVRNPLQTMEMGDLMGYGCLGLIQALDRFDESEGKEFSNYAFLMISTQMWMGMKNFGLQRSQYRKQRKGENFETENPNRYRRKEIGMITPKAVYWEEDVNIRMAIRQEMERLEETEILVLERICLDGMTQGEAAGVLSLSLYETRKCLKNTVEKLKNYLESP